MHEFKVGARVRVEAQYGELGTISKRPEDTGSRYFVGHWEVVFDDGFPGLCAEEEMEIIPA